MRARADVDTEAIRANVETLGRAAGAAGLLAVVKADGYGHGAVPSAHAVLAAGASWLGVALIDEALQLRAAGITVPILVLLEPGPGAAAAAVEHDLDLGVGTTHALTEAADFARLSGDAVRVHLKVDTGLARGGATRDDWPDLVTTAAKLAGEGVVRVVGVWSHFVHSDDVRHPTTTRQLAAFRDALDIADRSGLQPEVRHIASSGAALALPEAHFDLVRPGLAVYGLSPMPATASPAQLGLRPAMTLRAQVSLVKRVPRGTGVSYGHRYTTGSETSLALVPLGYADGVPRAATNTAELLIGGRRRRISGTVCMDQFVVDVGDDAVERGDDVILFGPGDAGEPTAQDWADRLDTITYEIVTRVGSRVPRTYPEAS